MLGFKHPFSYNEDDDDCIQDIYACRAEMLNEAEEAGSSIKYIHPKCRNCKQCKNHESIEMMSIREDVEQDVQINTKH